MGKDRRMYLVRRLLECTRATVAGKASALECAQLTGSVSRLEPGALAFVT